jgi:hypothetical protein
MGMALRPPRFWLRGSAIVNRKLNDWFPLRCAPYSRVSVRNDLETMRHPSSSFRSSR